MQVNVYTNWLTGHLTT